MNRPGQLPNYEHCFVCGHGNPVGLNVRFQVEGDTVVARFRAENHHCGYPGRVHGGIIAALLDETMGWAPSVHTGRFSVSVELNIRYVKGVPPHHDLLVVATPLVTKGRIWEASGEVRDGDGTVYARGTGRFFPLTVEETDRIAAMLSVEGRTTSLAEAIAMARAETEGGWSAEASADET